MVGVHLHEVVLVAGATHLDVECLRATWLLDGVQAITVNQLPFLNALLVLYVVDVDLCTRGVLALLGEELLVLAC